MSKAPSGRELSSECETEGARALLNQAVAIRREKKLKFRGLLPPLKREPPKLISFVSGNPAAAPLPPGAISLS